MSWLTFRKPGTRQQRIRFIWASSFHIEDELDLLFGRAHPNPDRCNCPSIGDLWALARRRFPIGDARYEHLARCSPCFSELRGIQQTAASVVGFRDRFSRRLDAASKLLRRLRHARRF
jgi:hypothetical protein